MVVLHGNQVDELPKTYIRYLQGVMADAYSLVPVREDLRHLLILDVQYKLRKREI